MQPGAIVASTCCKRYADYWSANPSERGNLAAENHLPAVWQHLNPLRWYDGGLPRSVDQQDLHMRLPHHSGLPSRWLIASGCDPQSSPVVGWRHRVGWLLLSLLMLTGSPLMADDSRSLIKDRLAQLQQQDTLDEAGQRQQAQLRAALDFVDQQQRHEAALQHLDQRRQQLDGERQQLLRRLRSAPSNPAPAEPAQPEDASAAAATLRALLQQLAEQQRQLTEVSAELINLRTLPERARRQLNANLSRSNTLQNQLAQGPTRGDDNLSTEQLLWRAELAALDSHVALLRRQLWSSDDTLRIAELRQQWLQRDIERIEQAIANAQQRWSEAREQESNRIIQSALDAVPEGLKDSDDLRRVINDNAALGDELRQTTSASNTLAQHRILVDTQLDQTRRVLRNLNNQISALRGSLLLSRIIYEQQAALPKIQPVGGLDQQLAVLQLRRFALHELRNTLLDPAQQAAAALQQAGSTDDPSIRAALTDLLTLQARLVEELAGEIARQIALVITVQTHQQQLAAIQQTLRDTISEQSLWIPSNLPVNGDWFQHWPKRALAQWQQLLALPWADSLVVSATSLWRFLPAILFALLILLRRASLHAYLKRISSQVGRVHQDTHLLSLSALGCQLLLALPLPLLLASASWVLAAGAAANSVASNVSSDIVAYFLLRAALIAAAALLLYRLLAPGGVIAVHFKRSSEQVRKLRRGILLAALALLPLALAAAIARYQPQQLANDVLGVMLLSLTNLALAVLLLKVARYWPRSDSKRRRLNAGWLLALLPLVLNALIWSGYYYSAMLVAVRLLDSLYLVLLWLLLGWLAERSLAITARQMALKRAREKHAQRLQDSQSAQKSGEAKPADVIDDSRLEVTQINQQSLRLLRFVLLAGLGSLLYLVWADLLSTASYAENVMLWSSGSSNLEPAGMAATSLGEVVTALVIMLVAAILIRNLPGLLEVVILSRLQLAPGSSYAITTLLKYLIFSVALISALSALGLAWNKLQWLVAALGVGLGFGLQEIFANFVSGLIILFERPVRIGDTITVGDLSGTVSKIRIRATTITDFDHKEIIVPNKVFITDQLINWSLTDPVTRVIVRVGFAYGSDVELARRLLLQAARECPLVMPDPEPQAWFTAFGESTLDHELRVHVRDITDRFQTIDFLNRRIDQLCRDHHLEIAFNQMDIHIIPPEES